MELRRALRLYLGGIQALGYQEMTPTSDHNRKPVYRLHEALNADH